MNRDNIFISMTDAENLSRRLADEIAGSFGRPDLLVGIANGAIVPTKLVADRLGDPYEMVKIRRQGSRIKQRLLFLKKAFRIPGWLIMFGPLQWFWKIFQNRYNKLEQAEDAFNFKINGRTIVLVDDEMVTGNSVRHVQEELATRGSPNIRIAVLSWYRGKGNSGSFAPDVSWKTNIIFIPGTTTARTMPSSRHGCARTICCSGDDVRMSSVARLGWRGRLRM